MDPHLERVRKAIESAVSGLSGEQLEAHPSPGKWSAAEILEHLSRTYSGTAKAMQRNLDAGRPEIRPATMKEAIAAALVVEAGHMPRGRQAPEYTRPKGMAGDVVLAQIRQNLDGMEKVLAECEHKFGPGKIGQHPILGPLTATQWRKFHWVHTRHHMKQIEALKKQMAPAGQSRP